MFFVQDEVTFSYISAPGLPVQTEITLSYTTTFMCNLGSPNPYLWTPGSRSLFKMWSALPIFQLLELSSGSYESRPCLNFNSEECFLGPLVLSSFSVYPLLGVFLFATEGHDFLASNSSESFSEHLKDDVPSDISTERRKWSLSQRKLR